LFLLGHWPGDSSTLPSLPFYATNDSSSCHPLSPGRLVMKENWNFSSASGWSGDGAVTVCPGFFSPPLFFSVATSFLVLGPVLNPVLFASHQLFFPPSKTMRPVSPSKPFQRFFLFLLRLPQTIILFFFSFSEGGAASIFFWLGGSSLLREKSCGVSPPLFPAPEVGEDPAGRRVLPSSTGRMMKKIVFPFFSSPFLSQPNQIGRRGLLPPPSPPRYRGTAVSLSFPVVGLFPPSFPILRLGWKCFLPPHSNNLPPSPILPSLFPPRAMAQAASYQSALLAHFRGDC